MIPSTRFFAYAGSLSLFLSSVAAAPAARVNDTTSDADDQPMKLMDAEPVFPHDPNTVSNCAWWWDNDGSIPCADMPAEWGITLENFLKWNPSITSSCGNFLNNRAYCVEAPSSGPEPTGTTTTAPPTTTTAPGNGVTTPSPIQEGMVTNCAKFHYISEGDRCQDILSYQKITLADFYKWNPAVKADCSGLWGKTHACVGVIGGTTTTSTPPTTTTAPGNGVATPSPIQEGMVKNCAKFHYISEGDRCQDILSYQKITLADFFKWNPAVKADCSGLWGKTHACVGVIGGTTTTAPPPTTTTQAPPTTTKGPNGITTPLPTQAGMVSNCNKFHYISEGDKCGDILSYQKITLANFFKWNPAVKSDCSGLWGKTNACVGVY